MMGKRGDLVRKSPLVTVCVLVYNGEDYLKESVDSLLRQTYKNFELYILDNHSTDRTPEIAKSYTDPRVRYVRHPKNVGSLGNFNIAIGTGKGELLAIFHDDDVYERTILEEQVRVHVRHPKLSCVYTRATIINEHGKSTGVDDIPESLIDHVLPFNEVYSYALRTMRSPFITPSNMTKRRAYRKAGKYLAHRFSTAGDADMHLRLAAVGGAYIIGKRLIRYRHTPGQASIRYSTTYTIPNQFLCVLERHLKRADVSKKDVAEFALHKDWDFTVRAVNMLAKPTVSAREKRAARSLLRQSLTWRRLCASYKYPLLFAITVAMLVAAHAGFGRPLARKINAERWRRHLEEQKEQ